jgi:hypothetical protein
MYRQVLSTCEDVFDVISYWACFYAGCMLMCYVTQGLWFFQMLNQVT